MHFLLNIKKLLVPYNKLSVVFINYKSNIETSKCNICFQAKKTCLSLNILNEERGLVSKETVVLRRWGSGTREFGLSTVLIM